MITDLHRRINNGELKPGLPAPSESELIGQFGVSSTTARRCLNELAQSGLVYRVQGRGTFVSELAEISMTRQIGIFYHDLIDLTNGFVANALRGVNDVIVGSSYQPALLTLGGVAQAQDPAIALRQLVERHQLDGLLILSPIPPKWLEPTLDLGLPVVAVNFGYTDSRITCVLADHDTSVQRLVERVEAAGHQRCVALRGHFDPVLVEGVQMTKLEIPPSGSAEWTIEHFQYFQSGVVAQLVNEHLARKSPPTVFLCFGHDAALEVAAVVRSHGWSVPQDLSIVFIGSPSSPTQYSGEIAPVFQMSAKATACLIDRLNKKPSSDVSALYEMLPQEGTTLGQLPDHHSSSTR